MKNVAIKNISVYKFDELTKEAQDKAVLEHVNFLIEFSNSEDEEYFVNQASAEMEKMRTPWFLGETLYFDYRKDVEEGIRANEYDYYPDGSFFSLDKHLSTGSITESK
jgi:hypothetical protein